MMKPVVKLKLPIRVIWVVKIRSTFYVGTLKGVGRIYQQTFIDTYSKIAFAKLYTTKTPITAADMLNDKVLPFFEQHELPLYVSRISSTSVNSLMQIQIHGMEIVTLACELAIENQTIQLTVSAMNNYVHLPGDHDACLD